LPDQGTYYAVTANSGGYALPIEMAGTYEVTFSGGVLGDNVVKTVMIGDDSELLDLVDGSSSVFSPGDTSGSNNSSRDDGDDGGGGCFITGMGDTVPTLSPYIVKICVAIIISINLLAAIRRKL